MKQHLLIFISFFVTGSVSAQKENKHQLQFSLNSVAISDVPRYNIGYFYQLNEKYSIGTTIGFATNDILLGSVGNKTWTEIIGKPQQGYRLFEIRPEIQKFFRRDKKTLHFISLQAYYLHHTDYFENGVRYYTSDQNWEVRAESADFKRIKAGMLFQYGMQIAFNNEKTFGLIPKTGIGIRNRYVKYNNLTNPSVSANDSKETQMFLYFSETETNFYKYTGTTIGFDMNFDVSLFYRF